MNPVFFLQSASEGKFDGFHGASLVLLVAGCIAAVAFALLYAALWYANRPRTPEAGPAVADLGPEPPAIANMLVNGWRVTRIAMAATLVDLAGRRVLGIEDYAAGNHVVRIRSNQPEGETFTGYEKQVLDLVRSRATGGSCPVEVLDLGESDDATRWWKRFEKQVKSDAQDRGLARGRWTHRDRVVIGVALAVPLLLLSLALGVAHFGETASEDSDRWGWVYGAGVIWVVGLVALVQTGALRETDAGRVAAGRWLGVRQYLRNSAAFGELPPGSVAVWERYLAYATAFGLAHDTARALPFATDDPGTAWTRYGGQWRQVRISYPTRFMFGQPPPRVLLYGLGLTAFWGAIAFFLLPVAFNIGWDVGHDVLNGEYSGSTGIEGQNDTALRIFVLGFVGVFLLFAAYVLFRLIGGLGRLVLGLMDAGKTTTLTGEVVNIHQGRIAIADAISDETRAWFPPVSGPALRRGMIATITRSPRLWYVSKVEVVRASSAAEEHAEAPEAASMPAAAARAFPPIAILTAALAGTALTAETVSSIAGIPLTPVASDGNAPPGALTFGDGEGGMVRVYQTADLGGATNAFMGLLTRLPRGDRFEVAGNPANWIGDRVLMVPAPQGMVTVDIELAGLDGPRRREIAAAIAERALATTAPAPAPE